jgi:tetratricopeptide (TPR) repeat protein
MKTDIESKINEAEVCRSMGLLADSLSIYEKILGSVTPQDAPTHEKIEKRIRLLRQEIDSEAETAPKGVSQKDISMLRERLSNQGDVPAILDSASAFKEMGLHGEAIPEYAKLFKEDYPVNKVVPEMIESLLKLHSPPKASEDFKSLIDAQKLEKKDVANIMFIFGQEMEKRDHREVALDIYKRVHGLNPGDADIKKRMDSVAATFTTGSKYEYLLREKMVTTDQLQQAFALAKKMKKSVEFVLIEHNKINKAAIGKSFSLFYDTSFRQYDPAFTAPVELLSNLKKTFLLNEYWVPMSWDKEGVEILVDDPRDLNKTDNIRALMKTRRINFTVAIREDIEQYIKQFFDGRSSMDESTTVDQALDDFDLIPDVSFEEEEEEEIEDDGYDEASGKIVKLVDQVIKKFVGYSYRTFVDYQIDDDSLPVGRRLPGVPEGPQFYGSWYYFQSQNHV